MDIKNHHIILLEQLPTTEQQAITYCFYCRSCPYHGRKVKAVAAVEITSPEIEAFAPGKGISFTGICSNHAEIYPRTEKEIERRPLLCLFCFNRDGTRREQ